MIKDGHKRRLNIKNCSSRDDGKYACKMQGQETAARLFVERKCLLFLILVKAIWLSALGWDIGLFEHFFVSKEKMAAKCDTVLSCYCCPC